MKPSQKNFLPLLAITLTFSSTCIIPRSALADVVVCSNGGSGNDGCNNTGSGNNGSNNDGHSNTGSGNTGDANTGSNNTGNGNTGSGNAGNNNGGSNNTGNANAGSGNTGDSNTGSSNSGSSNYGSGNTGSGNYGSGNNGSGNYGTENTGNGNSGTGNVGSGNNGSNNGGDSNVGTNNWGNANNGTGNSGNSNDGSGNGGNENVGTNNNGNGNTGSGNAGNDNTGSNNSASGNYGSGNTGNSNHGSSNSGAGNYGSGNSGDSNSGSTNAGNENVGSNNVGNNNAGSLNNGSANYGTGNTGDGNFGSGNVGGGNAGSGNSGDGNVGSVNAGDGNIGSANTGDGNVGAFNNGDSNSGVGNNGSDNNGNGNDGQNNYGNGNVGDNNVGNDNNGNNNNGNNNIGNNHVGNNNEDEWHLKYNQVIPLFFGNLGVLKKAENLTRASDTGVVALDQYSNGFRVTKDMRTTLALGAAATYNFPHAGDRYDLPTHMNAGVGLVPVSNSSTVFEIVVRNLEDANTRTLRIPRKASDLSNFSVGEKVSFQSEGGLVASLAASVYFVAASPSFVALGGYTTTVEKMSDDIVAVSIVRRKLNGIGFGIGTIGAQAYIGDATTQSRSYDMVFKTSTPEGARAYEAAIHGDVASVQAAENSQSVQTEPSVDTLRSGILFNRTKKMGIRIALPFIPVISYNAERSYQENFSFITSERDQALAKSFYGMHMQQRDSRVGDNYAQRYSAFYAGTKVTERADHRDINVGLYFKFQDSDTYGSTHDMTQAIKRLKAMTGLGGLLNLQMPAARNEMRYTNIEFDISWSEDYVRYLMAAVASTEYDRVFMPYLSAATSAAQAAADAVGSPRSRRRANATERAEAVSERLTRAYNEIKAKITDMRMYAYLDASNFGKAGADVGKILMANPELFYGFYEQGQKCGSMTKFLVTGQRISRIERTTMTERATSECRY